MLVNTYCLYTIYIYNLSPGIGKIYFLNLKLTKIVTIVCLMASLINYMQYEDDTLYSTVAIVLIEKKIRTHLYTNFIGYTEIEDDL